ncbi:MAG: hypothetical protein WD971_12060 [Pirellulales bacterium]
MTERERWIVYPLLFLALGAALRDKLSEHTKTKTIECQELIVYGDEGADQQPVPLVQIGAVKRTSADSPHVGQILVNGLIQAQGVRADAIQADSIQTTNINADKYYFRRVPFAPQPVRAVPGMSTGDWLRAQQHQAAGTSEEDAQAKDAAAAGDSPTPVPGTAPATDPKSRATASPPAD